MKTPHPELSEWIASPDEQSAASHFITLGDALRDAAAKWPDQDAVVYRHQPAVLPTAWTFAELDELSERLAGALLGLGFRPGERIAIWAPNCPEWILLEYAIAKAGLVLVALNPLYKVAELEFALVDSNVAGIFYADEIGGLSPEPVIRQAQSTAGTLRHTQPFSSIWTDLLPGAPSESVDVTTAPDSTFMIQYTSGTTGSPKAARLSHQAITTTARNSYHLWGLSEQSRVCHGFPLFHVGGSGNSIPGAALNGATTLPLYIFKAPITLDILEKERCTAFIGVPTMLIAMLDDPSIAGRSFDHLQKIIVGGAPVTRDLLEQCQDVFGADVTNCYGQTETCGVTTTTAPQDSAEKKTQTSGIPLAGVSVAIKNESGETVPHNTVGELHYKGPGRMSGYGAFPAEGESSRAESWLPSGDLARMDSEGFVSIVGRQKEMIIRGGENLSPVEIETFIRTHPCVSDVAVIGVPDRKYGEEVCAVVRTTPDVEISGSEIRQWCAERISRWKVPKYVELIDDFPLTPSGKIQKFILQKQMSERLGLDSE